MLYGLLWCLGPTERSEGGSRRASARRNGDLTGINLSLDDGSLAGRLPKPEARELLPASLGVCDAIRDVQTDGFGPPPTLYFTEKKVAVSQDF